MAEKDIFLLDGKFLSEIEKIIMSWPSSQEVAVIPSIYSIPNAVGKRQKD